jgi:hypothetical protein
MLKVTVQKIDRDPTVLHQLIFVDQDPYRGRPMNLKILATQAGLEAIRDAIAPVVKGDIDDCTVQER